MRNLLKWMAAIGAFGLVAGLSAYFTLTWFIGREPEVVVPTLVGTDIVDGLELLDQLGLDARVRGSEYSATIPKNRITFQSPEPGDRIKAGREVRIRLSRGIEQLPVPDLVGLKSEDAASLLIQSGFQDGRISRMYDESVPKNHVLATSPRSGKPAESGSRVALLVSGGKRPRAYRMPDLTGLDAEALMAEVEAIGLRVKTIETRWNPVAPENRVVRQDPEAGSRVTPGEAVTITLNRRPEGRGSVDQIRMAGVRLVRYAVPEGFLNRKIRLEVRIWGETFTPVDRFFRPGETVRYLIPATSPATARIFMDDVPVYLAEFDPFSASNPIRFSLDRFIMPVAPTNLQTARLAP